MKNAFLTTFCLAALVACNKPEKPAEPVVEAKPQPVEFADSKYVNIGKQRDSQLASGDIDGWLNSYADNATYVWSSGDSLSGKKAIADYWKDRRTKVIESITISNDIWLPLNVNQPQKNEQPGVWLLSWSQSDVKYKNGKKVTLWIHTLAHFDSSDKVDRVIQYLDRAPINAALAKK